MTIESGAEYVLAEFAARFGGSPRLYRAPGRINIIGEHTDYNGGFVLPATVDLFCWAAIAPRDDRLLRVHLCQYDHTYTVDLSEIKQCNDGSSFEYIKAVAWSLTQEGIHAGGSDMVIHGNIPLGGGLSSSAALEMLLAYGWLDSVEIKMDRGMLAHIAQRAESEFVGVQCGIMDQYTIALAQPDHAMKLNCRTLEHKHIAIPTEFRFLIIHSGVRRQLPEGDYNSRTHECAQAVAILQKSCPEIEYLSDLSAEQIESGREKLGEVLYRRCRHVLTENQRVHDASIALLNGDRELLGQYLTESHHSLRDDFEVSCAQLDHLVEVTSDCPWVAGSRMMGAGFGGCTISLVEANRIDEVKEFINDTYGAETGREPWMHVVGSASAVKRIGMA